MIKHLLRGTVGATVFVLSLGSPVAAAVVLVTPATLQTAFAAARGGDTLRLVGTFGTFRLQNHSFAQAVTLDARYATFTDSLILQNDTNVKLSRGTFAIAGGSTYNAAIEVWGGSNIAVDRAVMTGNGQEVGINFEGTTNATATNGVFDGLHVAVSLGSVTGGTAAFNRITHAVVDGIDIGDSHFVTANNNACSLGTPGPGAHADCIQLWSQAGRPLQSDITVTRNTATGPTQGFTSFSNGGGALRVTISHNTVNTSDSQGIACYACIDSTISYNSISTLPGAAHPTGISIIRGTNNTVIGNVIHPRPPVANVAFARAALAVRPGLSDLSAPGGLNGMGGSPAAVPEPATWAMLVTGFAAVGAARRAARRPRTLAA